MKVFSQAGVGGFPSLSVIESELKRDNTGYNPLEELGACENGISPSASNTG